MKDSNDQFRNNKQKIDVLSEQKNDCVTKFTDCEKNMTLVKKKWEFLDMDDKMHYKNKITNL